MRLTNYPNPFNPTTTIRFHQDRPGLAVVRMFTMLGQEVYVEEQFNLGSGDQSLVWKGQDRDGHDLPSGTYIVQVQTTQGSASRKIMLLR
jgi:flagellar hook assembly protein FlgD